MKTEIKTMGQLEVIGYNGNTSWFVILDGMFNFARGTTREAAIKAAVKRLDRLKRLCEAELENDHH